MPHTFVIKVAVIILAVFVLPGIALEISGRETPAVMLYLSGLMSFFMLGSLVVLSSFLPIFF